MDLILTFRGGGVKDNKLMRKLQPHLLETFDDTFNEAVQQLVQWGGVILGEDSMLVPLSGYSVMWLTHCLCLKKWQALFSTRDAQHDMGLRVDSKDKGDVEQIQTDRIP